MMKIRLFLFVMAWIGLISGCSHPSYPAIKEENYLLTLNLRDSSLTFIDQKGERIADWVLEDLYTGGALFPNDDRLLLYGTQLDRAAIFSLSEGKMLDEWKVREGTTGALYLKDSKEVVLANKKDRSLHFYNEKGKETAIVKTGKYPMSLAEHQGMLYVINYQDTILSEVDLKKKKVVREFTIPSSSTGLMIEPNQRELWIGGHGHGKEPQSQVQVYSLDTGQKIEKINTPIMPVNFASDGNYHYVVSHGSNMIYMLNDKKEIKAKLKVGANPFTIEPFANEIVIAGYDSDELYFLEKGSLKLVKKVKTGKGPFMMFVKEENK
ncbi:YncE family protein [Bacillus sp. Hm123]|uniref:YncE family protein n=1 Tax=Bacillus sp. Hm123 TaxID=3450745 RepID=UPI003F430934